MPADPFAALAVVLPALMGASRSLLLGSVLFLALVLRPAAWLLGGDAVAIHRDVARIAGWSAQGLVVCALAVLLPDFSKVAAAGLAPPGMSEVLFVKLSAAGAGAAWLIALLLAVGWAPSLLLLPLAAVVLAAALLLAEPAAEPVALAIVGLHLFGAAIWIGGLPAFAASLARLSAGGWDVVAARFAFMALLGGAALAASGAALAWRDVTGPLGDPLAFCGSGYGVLVGAKIVLFLALLALAAGNLRAVRRRRGRSGLPPTRLRRFAEVEIGIGASAFLVAGALAATPPPSAQARVAVTWQQVLDRARPTWPRLANPLAQAPAAVAIVRAAATDTPPGAAERRSVEARAGWAGVGIAAIGLLALLGRARRHLGGWRVPARRDGLALLPPIVAVLAGTALLIADADAASPAAVLAALVRTPLALSVIAAGWARWLELRLDPFEARWAGWVWPVCLLLIGFLLAAYPG